VTASFRTPIRLDQFLKLTGLAVTGGHAKTIIQAGDVRVNGVVETHRSRDLVAGDVVRYERQELTVIDSSQPGPAEATTPKVPTSEARMAPFVTRTLHETAADLRAGRTTCAAVLESCLAQIDRREPEVRAWVSVDRDGARRRAAQLDEQHKAGQSPGLLHGIPVGIKDIVDIEGLPTVAGYPPWSSNIAKANAAVVDRLLGHGAIIVGKTVTTMFAGFDPPVTRNPWNTGHTPGGSSSGSAAAVGAGMCLGSFGTQTGGSITRPASFCGAAACKPTFGRVDLTGIVPLSATMDHGGPMAPCVRDVAILLEALVTPPDAGLPAPADAFVSALDAPLTTPLRIGRLRGFFEFLADDAMNAALDRATDAWRAAGATVVDIPLPTSFETILNDHKRLISGGAAQFHRERFLAAPETFLPKIRELIEDGLKVSESDLVELKRKQERARLDLVAAIERTDAAICPATRGPAPDITTTGDPSFNAPWSFTGLPVVSFPFARAGELPLCVQVVGRPFEEASLLRTSAWLEGKTTTR
jgi:aspartyl-tRNA(Asn)/glutamyl-tRNA(Gln) amidotransferase subunit A